jgi:hypothetical protein
MLREKALEVKDAVFKQFCIDVEQKYGKVEVEDIGSTVKSIGGKPTRVQFGIRANRYSNCVYSVVAIVSVNYENRVLRNTDTSNIMKRVQEGWNIRNRREAIEQARKDAHEKKKRVLNDVLSRYGVNAVDCEVWCNESMRISGRGDGSVDITVTVQPDRVEAVVEALKIKF